ncbi:hypothetical protein O0555_04580 [Brevibacillus laterosporus]|uniref:hypothetical protein n=1 Tax=Brevibacillus laterosporus TaxID=1465 RepID=UPI0018CCC63E|nr:hypothetical protein [Brevibacillus laterosporus]MBG9776068.1 hypothetical protein [Brevibacillus laterosporus]MBG9796737.1 hypothetical protein [Brevibacillus laterosporus]MCR8936629.1 hypothetical protein [Brevibacillus laterosporus]MCZ0839268.1 hypothetical protein [Brevibacillus laterosporus]MCZ0844132.1 hypothetical protein [Brevibacillus laterosporus]
MIRIKKKLLWGTVLLIIASLGVTIYVKNMIFTTDYKISNYQYLFLYSNPFKDKSHIVMTNDGKSYDKVTLKISDTPIMGKNSDNNLMLPAEHVSKYYIVNNNFDVTEQKLNAPYTFFIKEKDIEVESFNTNISDNDFKVTDRIYKKEYSIKLPAFINNAIYDSQNIFVLIYNVETELNEVHVINRQKGYIDQVYQVNDGASEMLRVRDFLLLNTKGSLTILNINSGNILYYKYPSEVAEADKMFFYQKGTIFLTYADYHGNLGLLVLDDHFSEQNNLRFDIPLMKSKLIKDKIFVLSQIKNDPEIGGKFCIIDANTLRIEQLFNLPKEDIKVQDFMITK